MRTSIFILLCSLVVSAQAQIFDVKRQTAITALSGTRVFYPSLNEDGTRMLLTSENYKGLSLYCFQTRELQPITSDEGAGLAPTFIESPQFGVVYESMKRQQGRVYKTIKQYDGASRQSRVVKSSVRSQSEITQLKRKAAQSTLGGKAIQVSNESLNMYLRINGVTKELKPLGDIPGYLWVSLSPDQKMILFTGVGRGTYICDLSGKIKTSLGYLNAPVWFDNSCVVGMVDRDNGQEVISSSIVAVSTDGKKRQTISSADQIAMYPSVSAKAKKIVYNTSQGRLYLLDVEKK